MQHNMTYSVQVTGRREVHELPGDWSADQLRRLLELADAEDIGQIDDADLAELAAMALQDLGVQRAGECVLEAVFGDAMRPGVRQNLVDDLQDDRPWDQFPDLRRQRGVFTAVVMLQRAFPTRFATPDAIHLDLEVGVDKSASAQAREALMQCRPDWLVRVLAAGQQEDTVLRRMFADEVAGAPFADAEALLWHHDCRPLAEDRVAIDVLTSAQWVAGLADGDHYVAASQ